MFKNQTLQKLFGIDYPIIQGGMVWVSGANLAAACANAGALGLIGAGSMDPELLKLHIRKAKSLTDKPFGVNLPLLYRDIEKQISVCLDEGIDIFFTSAGSPKKFTPMLKERGCKVVHVASTPLLAKKCEDAGVDAVVAEGFEAGGHNGREELTTMTLIPQVVDTVKIPVIAAGGIADGRGLAAAMALGACGVQIGSRFAASKESSAHENFKQAIVNASFDSTELSLKSLVPVRLLKNHFYQEVKELESRCSTPEQLKELLGKGRAKAGMFDGDMESGELEIGQISGMIQEIKPVQEIVNDLVTQYKAVIDGLI